MATTKDKEEKEVTPEEVLVLVKKKKAPKKFDIISGLGRRKRSTARVWLTSGKGEFFVNDKPIDEYFKGEAGADWQKPFYAVGISHPTARFGGTIKVEGGGTTGQLDAVTLGCARALLKVDPEWRIILRKQGFLTRDPRETERKKYWFRKARKRPQFSKR